MATSAVIFQIGKSSIKYCISNTPKLRTAIVTYNVFGRLFLWSASLSMIARGISGVLGFSDGYEKRKNNKKIVEISYYVRDLATIVLSISQFVMALGSIVLWFNKIIATSMERSIWYQSAKIGGVIGGFIDTSTSVWLATINFYASFIIVVVSLSIIILDDDAIKKWFDRCCFSKN